MDPDPAPSVAGARRQVFGQVFVAGVTEAAGSGADIAGELGIGATTDDASASDGAAFSWSAAFNKQAAHNDEYAAALSPTALGDYAYAFRFKCQGGPWTYCDPTGAATGLPSPSRAS